MSRSGRSGLKSIKGGADYRSGGGGAKALPDFLRVNLKRIKPFHETLRYGSTVGRIRVLETQLLSSHRVERLVEADFEEALHILDEIAIGDYLAGATSPGDVDRGLTEFLKGVYENLAEALPRDSFLMEYFLCRYDFHNLKALFKGRDSEKEPEALLPGLGNLDIERLRKGIQDPTALPSPYKEAAAEILERGAAGQQVDTIVDRHFLTYRLLLAGREENYFVMDYSRASIDLANLKTVVRGRNLGKNREFVQDALVEGGFIGTGMLLDIFGDAPEVMLRKLENTRYYSDLLKIMEEGDEVVRLTDFDRRSDDFLMDMVRGTKRISVGAEPIFAYVRARENEVTQVRIILMAKLHNVSPPAIEKMLRKLYID